MDMATRRQTNTVTGYSRDVRRVLRSKAKTKAVVKAKKIKNSSAVLNAGDMVSWEWLDNDDGTWKPYNFKETQSEY